MTVAECVGLLPRLTDDAEKLRWYGRDTYFIECVDQLGELTDDVAGFALRHSVVLLKPEALVTRQVGPAVDWLAGNGFRVVAAECVAFSPATVRALWYFHWALASPERRRLADLLTTLGDALVLVVRHRRPTTESTSGPPTEPAAVLLTRLKGPTDPHARAPGELRHLLGRYSYLLNLAHTPDDPADVLRELGVDFDEATRGRVLAAALAGHDVTDRALALAEQLYAAGPERNLDFEPALARLRSAVAAARPSVAGAPPRLLLEQAWRSGIDLDPWDVLVVGSQVLPMRREGTPGTVPSRPPHNPASERRRHDVGQ